jgi:hypothetical protein
MNAYREVKQISLLLLHLRLSPFIISTVYVRGSTSFGPRLLFYSTDSIPHLPFLLSNFYPKLLNTLSPKHVKFTHLHIYKHTMGKTEIRNICPVSLETPAADQQMLHNRWHPDVPFAGSIKDGETVKIECVCFLFLCPLPLLTN